VTAAVTRFDGVVIGMHELSGCENNRNESTAHKLAVCLAWHVLGTISAPLGQNAEDGVCGCFEGSLGGFVA
jgi:hypothetical protein